jgi:uncharacterized membrane protein
MNAAHLHLISVHFPIVLIPCATALFAFAIWRKNDTLRNFALFVFVVSALVTAFAFSVGEDAEEIVEHIAGIKKATIHEHEEAAESAIWFSSILGVLSFISLFSQKLGDKVRSILTGLVMVASILASVIVSYAGYEGGKIRHPEAADAHFQKKQEAAMLSSTPE